MNDNQNNNNILVAMSGGVDSAVAAMMLKKEGYNVKSAILRMHDAAMTQEDLINGKLPAPIWYAREASRKLRLDFSIIDVRDNFDKRVTEYFIRQYKKGEALNSGYYLEKYNQIPEILEAAKMLDCPKVAIGHYAIIEFDPVSERYILKKSREKSLDQSYKLSRLTQEQLSKLITPLGEYDKETVRKMAEDAKLKNAKAADTLCFIPDKDYWKFVGKRLKEIAEKEGYTGPIIGMEPGNFVDKDGNVIGQHRGFLYYTIGKREGLDEDGIAEDLFVGDKIASNNNILLTREEDLYVTKVKADKVTFISYPELTSKEMKVTAKMEYQGEEYPGIAKMLENDVLEVTFEQPVPAPIRGRGLVIYDGDLVVAGGIII